MVPAAVKAVRGGRVHCADLRWALWNVGFEITLATRGGNMLKRLLILVVLVVAVGTAGFGARTLLNSVATEKRPAYTVVWQATDYYSDGKVEFDHIETRYVSSTGNWRSIRHYADGKRDETFGEVGRGVFVIGRHKLHFLSEYGALPQALSEEQLRKSPNHLRADQILGYDAIVVSFGNRPRTCSELFKVPALGGEVLKTVICHNELGDKTVLEPIRLVLGEPDPSLLKFPTDRPVDYEHYNQTHPD